MCGRFTITITKDNLDKFLKKEYNITHSKTFNVPNYNVGPGQDIISIIHDGVHHRVGYLKWGFVPPIKIKTLHLINARAETLFELPSYKESAQKRRCVILADSFFEWAIQPYRIKTNDELFKMAGIYNTYIDEAGKSVSTVLIITTKAAPSIAHIHERMPVILNRESEKIWLNKHATIHELKSVLKPFSGQITFYPVSHRVNSIYNNDSDLIKEVDKQKDLFD